MSAFAAVLLRSGDRWTGREAELADCESLSDLADVLRDETEQGGTLPIDVLMSVCEKAGCAEVFEELRG